MAPVSVKEEQILGDQFEGISTVQPQQVAELFRFFKSHRLFNWNGANNDCEDRANALSLILTEWGVPNMKVWVFSGWFLKKEYGQLKNYWNYHVAVIIPVQDGNGINFSVIDPSILQQPGSITDWAGSITEIPYNYYILKDSRWYIFNGAGVRKYNWHERNQQNLKWTIQGLAGINGVSREGKARLVFNKNRIKNTYKRFQSLKGHNPFSGS